CDMRVGGKHDRDRLAHMSHLVHCKDRLIVEGGPVVRRWNEAPNIVARDDAMDAGQCARRAHIDTSDAAMCDRAAQELRIKHPGQAQIVHVLRAAGHFRAALEPPVGVTDLRMDRVGHDAIAWTSARRTPTRSNSFLYEAVPCWSETSFASAAAASAARRRAASSRDPPRAASAATSRVGLSVAAPITMRMLVSPSAAATPSAGQSSAERAVYFQ